MIQLMQSRRDHPTSQEATMDRDRTEEIEETEEIAMAAHATINKTLLHNNDAYAQNNQYIALIDLLII